MLSLRLFSVLVICAAATCASAQAMSGTYTIANGNPGSAYSFGDLGAAFNALEINGVSGPVVLELYDAGGPFTSNGSYQLGGNIGTLEPVSGLSATNTLTIRAAAGNSPVITGSGAGNRYTTSAFGTLSFDQVNYVTIEGLEITGGGTYGIMWLTWNGPLIETVNIRKCRIHGITAGAAIVFYYPASGGGANNVTIENNMCWNCYGDGGTALFSRVKGVIGSGRAGTNWVVRHNTVVHTSGGPETSAFFNSGAGAIAWADFSYNVTYFSHAAANPYYRLETATATNIPTVANRNVVFLSGSTNMCNNTTYGTWSQWQTAGKDTNGVNTDPLLTSITAPYDLRLLPGSPAIDLAVGSPVTSDFFGNPRPSGPAADAGAHEAPSGPPPDMGVELTTAPGPTAVADGGNVAIGDVAQAGSAFTFTINNTGAGDLYLLSTPPVQITLGANCAAGTVLQTQPTTPIGPAGSATFTVFVQPAGLGALDFTLNISNTDPGKNPYNFSVTGNGIPNNAPAVVNLAAGSAFGGAMGGPFTLAVDPGATLANAAIELADPDSDTIAVTSVTPNGTVPLGISAPVPPGTPMHPVVLTWTGTIDPANPPQAFSWTVTFADTGDGTPVNCTVTISINDLAPGHTIANATGGIGTPSVPYTAGFTHGDTGANSVDLATVTDPNTSQPLSLGAITPWAGNPSGGSGFMFSFAASLLTVAPAGTLQTADLGIHTFDVVVTDGANPITIVAELEVVGVPPTFTSAPVTTAKPGDLYTYTAATTGIPAPTLSAGTLPTWLTFNPATGELTGTPPNTAAKTTISVTLTASNGIAPNATQAFDIVVDRAPGAKTSTGDSGGCAAGMSGFAWMLGLPPLLFVAARRRRVRQRSR